MDSAVIAVIGTIAGAMVTTASTLLGAFLASHHQRATADRQLSHAVDQGRRAERVSFVDYLTAYSDLWERIVTVEYEIARSARREAPDPTTGSIHGRRSALRVAEYAHDESAKFSRAYQTLRITANDATGQAAQECTSRLWDLADREAIPDVAKFNERWELVPRPGRLAL